MLKGRWRDSGDSDALAHTRTFGETLTYRYTSRDWDTLSAYKVNENALHIQIHVLNSQ